MREWTGAGPVKGGAGRVNLMGVDIGTTALKTMVFDGEGNVVASAAREYELLTPAPRVVEIEVDTWWNAFRSALSEMFRKSGVAPSSIRALAVSSQGETIVPVDGNGRPLRRAIVWMDDRAVGEAEVIGNKFHSDTVFSVTGQPDILPSWPAAKLMWLRENEPDVFRRAARFLFPADLFVHRLTGSFRTEHSLVTSSLLFDIRARDWWGAMLDFVGMSPERLPELSRPGTAVGPVLPGPAGETGLSTETLVVTGAMDQAAGTVGAGNFRPGMVSETTGGALAICATADGPVTNPATRIPCHCHAVPDGYCLLPWCPTGGMALRWFRDWAGGGSYRDLDAEAARIPPGSEGLLMLPHLAGAGSPEFEPGARGAFHGISLKTGRGHFTRAIMESVAFMLRRNLEALEGMGVRAEEVRSLGGGARSALWNQVKADVIGRPVATMKCDESACLGAAILAGVAAGAFPSVEAACGRMSVVGVRYAPNPANRDVYERSYSRYLELSKRLHGFHA